MKPVMIFIFGGTGDLSNKKLYPALYALYRQGKLDDHYKLVIIGRRAQRTDQLRQHIFDLLQTPSRQMGDPPQMLRQFLKQVFYHDMTFESQEGYEALSRQVYELESLEAVEGPWTRIAYLATAPEYFTVISEQLSQCGILNIGNPSHRIVIEKPFGKDLASAAAIQKSLLKHMKEYQLYRMDHYLGKSMIQNVMVLRFANAMFEPIWNRDYIERVDLTVTETIGVGDRGGYYDSSGALRDMVQSHLLQMVALIAMEPPVELNYESLCHEKVKSIQSLYIENDDEDVTFGQYVAGNNHHGYRNEKGVHPDSNTETYVKLKLFSKAKRWQGVPFCLTTGKALSEKVADIVITFKSNLPYIKIPNAAPNQLRIRIQPEEGTSLSFNLIEPNNDQNMIVREMDYCQSCLLVDGSPEAYEILIEAALNGEHDLYTRWDEVESAWHFIDPLYHIIRNQPDRLKAYPYGSSKV